MRAFEHLPITASGRIGEREKGASEKRRDDAHDNVIQAIEDYETAHLVDRDRLLELATIAQAERADLLGQACARLIDDPESFTWPINDPFLSMKPPFRENTL